MDFDHALEAKNTSTDRKERVIKNVCEGKGKRNRLIRKETGRDGYMK